MKKRKTQSKLNILISSIFADVGEYDVQPTKSENEFKKVEISFKEETKQNTKDLISEFKRDFQDDEVPESNNNLKENPQDPEEEVEDDLDFEIQRDQKDVEEYSECFPSTYKTYHEHKMKDVKKESKKKKGAKGNDWNKIQKMIKRKGEETEDSSKKKKI